MITIEEILNSGYVNIEKLEATRLKSKNTLKHRNKTAAFVNVLLLLLSGGVYFLTELSMFFNIIVFVAPVAFFIIWVIVNYSSFSNSKAKVETEIITKVIKSINPDFNYLPGAFINERRFNDSRLIRKYNSLTGKNFFGCKINDSKVNFSELSVIYSIKRNESVQNLKVFSGIFFRITMKNAIKGSTAVVPRELLFDSIHGKTTHRFQPSYPEKLTITDQPELDSIFNVYTTNEQETRKLLTVELINYILKLRNDFDCGIFFSNSSDLLFLGISNDMGVFQNKYKDTKIDKEKVKKYYFEILSHLNCVQELLKIISENKNIKYKK